MVFVCVPSTVARVRMSFRSSLYRFSVILISTSRVPSPFVISGTAHPCFDEIVHATFDVTLMFIFAPSTGAFISVLSISSIEFCITFSSSHEAKSIAVPRIMNSMIFLICFIIVFAYLLKNELLMLFGA